MDKEVKKYISIIKDSLKSDYPNLSKNEVLGKLKETFNRIKDDEITPPGVIQAYDYLIKKLDKKTILKKSR